MSGETLSPSAAEALEKIKAVHTSCGWVITRDLFEGCASILKSLPQVLEELLGAGFLARTVAVRHGEDDYGEVVRDEEEVGDVLEALANNGMVAHPLTGRQVPAKDHVLVLYETTSKVPLLPPPSDPRAVELLATFRKEKSQACDRGRAAWEQAEDMLCRAFGLRRD